MASFKELGKFVPVEVDPHVKSGGMDIRGLDEDKFPNHSVRHPNFRLRPIDQQGTRHEVSTTDIDQVNLYPAKNLARELRVPEPEEVKNGLELELIIIDGEGNLFDLYGGDKVYKNGGNPVVEHTGAGWLIDDLGLNPEALRFIAEVSVAPGVTWDQLEINTLRSMTKAYRELTARGLLMLPAGNSGLYIENDWNNVATHPYIIDVLHYSLDASTSAGSSVLSFDECSMQTHNDHRPFGSSIDFGLIAANYYNGLLATLENAVSTSAPFNDSYLTGSASSREHNRRQLLTVGGVQDVVPTDGKRFLKVGDRKLRNGKIPVPERAYHSHSDTRPAKLTTGTFETGPADMTANFDTWLALTFVNRQFLIRTAECLKHGEPIPSFLINDKFSTKINNRDRASKSGNLAVVRVNGGEMTVQEAWDNFFEWAKPKDIYAHYWERSKYTIQRMLAPAQAAKYGEKALEMYFTSGWSGYLQGNQAEVMRAQYQAENGTPEERIKRTNVKLAKGFMEDIRKRLSHNGLL